MRGWSVRPEYPLAAGAARKTQ